MKLAEYRNKRDRATTPEPRGSEPTLRGPTRAGSFVVHLHAATRKHWDVRLECGGVLASFAVPKGPSLDPAEKRLAVRTEDHPFEYLEFEDVIPAGAYGAGAMIVWDSGRVSYGDRPIEEGLDAGKVDLWLDGFKLRGRFALVRGKGKPNEWLFFKKADAFSRIHSDYDVLQSAPRSVRSGLTVEELADRVGFRRRLAEHADVLGALKRVVELDELVPMLCDAGEDGHPLEHRDWLYELKLDGVRALAAKNGADAKLASRTGRSISRSYPEIARAVAGLACDGLVLDGEIVAFDEMGNPSFQRLGQRIHLLDARDVRRAAASIPAFFVVFDLLALEGRDLRDLPLHARKELLARAIPAQGVVRCIDTLEGDGRPLWALCEARDLEGVVAKRRTSKYCSGPRRTKDWIKLKRRREADFVVVGYTLGKGGRSALGALDLASYDPESGELVNRGKVGSGLDDAAIASLRRLLEPLARKTAPAKGELVRAPRGRIHVEPEVVVRVVFSGFSDDGQIRHGVFAGARDDVEARSCRVSPSQRLARDLESASAPADDVPDRPVAPSQIAPSEPPRARPRVGVSNRPKVLWPGEGITKGDLVDYYRAVAPAMLPHLRDRPAMLVRYPDGIQGKSFYQWNVPKGVPSWVRTYELKGDDGKSSTVIMIQDEDTLVYVANLAAIPVHILAWRVTTPTACDFATLDFDVKALSLRAGVKLARALKELLDAMGLPGFVKTSGQSGLHVFIPIGSASHETARALADLLGRLLVQRSPEIATMERVVQKRGPKVYIDTGQTGPGRTIAAPYSVRAVAGATVSTPLEWSEVTPDLDPRAFTLKTVPDRIRRMGDPMAELLTAHVDVAAAVARLEASLGPRKRG